MIPGSSLKGKMRTLLAKRYNEIIQANPNNDAECITRVFGSAKKDDKGKVKPSKILISDMFVVNEEEIRNRGIQNLTEVKFENSINRATAVANPRQIERAVKGLQFGVDIIYEVEAGKEGKIEEDIKVIAEAMRMLQYDYGRIPVSQLTAMARKIRGMDDYTVVALFHHHFYLFPEIAQRFGDSSLIRNYAEVMQQLSYMHVSVVMHGHKHYALERPFITEGYFESPENIIDVFAGGSVGTDRKDEHTFGVLDLYGKDDDIKLRHYKFCYKDEKLEPIKEKQVPPKKTSGRVVKLLEILEMLRPEKYKTYVTTSEKAFSS